MDGAPVVCEPGDDATAIARALARLCEAHGVAPRGVPAPSPAGVADLLADDADESTWHSIGRTGDEALLLAALDVVREDAQLHTWQAFWGMTVEGKSAAELAEVLGMTTKGVRQAKHRVLAKLREVLGDDASAILKHSMSADAAAWRSSQ